MHRLAAGRRNRLGAQVAEREITIEAIAKRLGVSTATVSYALTGRGRVSQKRVEEIQAVAAEMGYVPSHAGRSLRTGRSALVGLVVPNITNPIFPSLAQEIESELYHRGFGVLLADSHNNESRQNEAIQHLAARGAGSVIVIPCHGSAVPDMGIPTVIIDSAETPGNAVASDHHAGGRLMAEHLLSLGHRNILLLAGPTRSRVAQLRAEGFRSRFAEASGVDITIHHSGYGIAAGSLGTRQNWRLAMTAVAAVSDTLAIGALKALSQRGVNVPGEVSVTGFDDTVWAELVTPALTSVHQDVQTIAVEAVRIALGEREPGVIVPMSIAERASTANAPPTPVNKG